MTTLLTPLLRYKLLVSPFLRTAVWLVLGLAKCVIYPFSLLGALFHWRTPCPTITNKLLLVSATELASRIRSKQVSSEEVVKAYINRVKEVNPILNAVVQDRFVEAVQEAREVDKYLHSTTVTVADLARTKPLLGVPVTVKETIAVKGMSNSGAFSLNPYRVATEDADVVKSLRSAGAIILLVSNTPELCKCFETYNAVTGCTNNPYDTRRTPGGSSGGEAALLGSAASVVGVASDVCGSIRMPASYCGVYGHKPTPGYVNNAGHVPTSKDERWNRYFTLGPMTRYVEDLPLMLKTLIPDAHKQKELRLDQEVDLSKVRVYFMEDDGGKSLTDPVSPQIKGAMRAAATCLRDKYGVHIEQVSIKGLEHIMHYSVFLIMRMKGIPCVFQKNEDDPDDWNSMVSVFLKRMLCMSSASIIPLLYGPLKKIADSMSEEEHQVLLQRKNHLMKVFKDMLGEDGVFLYPTFPEPAHFHGQVLYKVFNAAYMSIFNVLEMPATACPLRLNCDGLPIGIQIATWQRQDRLSIAVAKALEEDFGGWIPPCGTP